MGFICSLPNISRRFSKARELEKIKFDFKSYQIEQRLACRPEGRWSLGSKVGSQLKSLIFFPDKQRALQLSHVYVLVVDIYFEEVIQMVLIWKLRHNSTLQSHVEEHSLGCGRFFVYMISMYSRFNFLTFKLSSLSFTHSIFIRSKLCSLRIR